MPVTKTAKRAVRSSKRKADFNSLYLAKLDMAIRFAKKAKTTEAIKTATVLADRASGKHMIHKNKAARIKGMLSRLLPLTHTKIKPTSVSNSKKKSSK